MSPSNTKGVSEADLAAFTVAIVKLESTKAASMVARNNLFLYSEFT